MDVLQFFLSSPTNFYPAGHELFRQGDDADVMYVLMDGIAEIFVHGTYVEYATPTALLGEMALVDGSRRSATVICRTDCRMVSITQREFDVLIKKNPQFARYVMAVMAKRLRRMNEGVKPRHTIEYERSPLGEWSYAVYAREAGGRRTLAGRFSTHEMAMQTFPEARQRVSGANAPDIPST